MIRLETTRGNVIIKLYDETPLHRDNFIKLIENKTYEGTLFHRVINNFMIQAGDPESREAKPGQMLGSGDVGYTIPAEIDFPRHYHRRGTLAAARQGDQVNPERNSSGCQFYIITGTVYSKEMLSSMEEQRNMKQVRRLYDLQMSKYKDLFKKMRMSNDFDGVADLEQKIMEISEAKADSMPDFKFTPEQIQDYTTVGGTPHLDGEYTVFGEVVEGMDVIDSIQKVETDRNDRPKEDIRILHVSVL
ncbi:MAG: peptidylprolyl isomerase [Bacteroidaceae bacterium]